MASSDFLPDRDGDLREWSRNFSRLLGLHFASYGLQASDAAVYADLDRRFSQALQTASDNQTNSRSSIVEKRIARRELEAEARKLARIIRANPAVTDPQRVALRLSVRQRGGSAETISPRALFSGVEGVGAPEVEVSSAESHRVRVRVRDRRHPDSRGKPQRILGVTVFTAVASRPPADDAAWRFHGQSTRTTMELSFDSTVPSGSTVWIRAQWVTRRLQPGPLSPPVYAMIPGGLHSAPGAAHHPGGDQDEHVPPAA